MDASSAAEAAPLALAQATLRLAQPRISALSHVVSLVSLCLDQSPRIRLANAASSGSAALLNRVARHLFNDQKIHEAVREHAFARAMEAAIKKDDLAMVRRLHELHPEPVVFKTLKAAILYGSLEMVEWVVDHRHDRLCCPPGVGNLCGSCLSDAVDVVGKKDACRVVHWLHERGYSLQMATTMSSSVDLVKWFHDKDLLPSHYAKTILQDAVAGATGQHLDVIKYLVDDGVTLDDRIMRQFLIQASLKDNSEAAVEYVISSRLCDGFRDEFIYAPLRPGGQKFIQWNPDLLSHPLRCSYASTVGGVRWLYDNVPDTDADVSDLKNGQQEHVLELYKWLHANNLGSWSTRDLDQAAANGHLTVVQWLHINRTEGCTNGGVSKAAANGHTDVVAWLLANRSEGDATIAMAAAATSGQIDVLAWLHENHPDGCTSCVLRSVLQYPFHLRAEQSERVPVLNSLRWLRDHQPQTECGRACVRHQHGDSSLLAGAVGASDLQLLAFLHSNYRDFDFRDLWIEPIVGTLSHFAALKWIREHYQHDFDWQEVRDEAGQQSASRASWLDGFAAGSEFASRR